MLDLSGTNNKLIDAINIVKRVRTFKFEEFLFFAITTLLLGIFPNTLLNFIDGYTLKLIANF